MNPVGDSLIDVPVPVCDITAARLQALMHGMPSNPRERGTGDQFDVEFWMQENRLEVVLLVRTIHPW